MVEKLNNEREIYRRAMKLAIPMMIQNGVTNAVGLVDSIMVGSLGSDSITAVSIASQLFFVFNLSIFGALSGPGIYGAQYFGQKNKEGFQSIVRLKTVICFMAVIIAFLVLGIVGDQLIGLYMLGEANSDINPTIVFNLTHNYVKIMMWQMVPFIITQIFASSLREAGESFIPMLAGVISIVIDVVLNYTLIYGKFGFTSMGVEGAAIATVISRYIEAIVIVAWLQFTIKKHSYFQSLYKTLKISTDNLMAILIKSMPLFINEFLCAGSSIILTQSYSLRGLDVLASMNISNSICNLVNVVFSSLGCAVGIITGQLLGASKFEEAKKNAQKLMWFTAGITVMVSFVLVSISQYFPLLFSTSKGIRNQSSHIILINALFLPLKGFVVSMYFTLRSGGKTIITFFFDSILTWLLPVPLAFVLCHNTNISIYAILALVYATDFVKICIGYYFFNKKTWITNLVAG